MMPSPAPKSKAPPSGPFSVFETAVPASKADAEKNSFAKSMERALVNPGPGSELEPSAKIPTQASSDSGSINNDGALLNPSMVVQTPLSMSQKPPVPSTKGTADQDSEANRAAGFVATKVSEVQDDEEEPNAVPCHPTVSAESQTVSLDALCSVLMLSVVAPVALEPAPRLPVEGDGESFQPSSESEPNSPMISAVESGLVPLNSALPSLSQSARTSNVLPAFNPLSGKKSEAADPGSPVQEGAAILVETPSVQPPKESEPPIAMGLSAGKEVAGDKNLLELTRSGMASAKKELQMKKTAENSKMSPSGDLCLPSAATSAAGAAVSAVSAFSRAKEPMLQDYDKLGAVSRYTQGTAGAPELVPSETISPADPKTVEKLEQTILHSVVELKRLGTESMSVVLRPDHQTELHLTVAVNQGQVGVEVRLSRGDMAHLQAEWGTLQQNLAQQGIRLQPLGQPQEFSQQGEGKPGGSSHFQRQDSGESSRRKNMLEEEMTSSQFAFKSRTEAARRLWETWA